MIPTRETYRGTSSSWRDTLKVSKQNRQSESPSRLRHAPCTLGTQLVVRGPQDAYPETQRTDTQKESQHSDCTNWMWCQSLNCTSPPSPETIARLHGQS